MALSVILTRKHIITIAVILAAVMIPFVWIAGRTAADSRHLVPDIRGCLTLLTPGIRTGAHGPRAASAWGLFEPAIRHVMKNLLFLITVLASVLTSLRVSER